MQRILFFMAMAAAVAAAGAFLPTHVAHSQEIGLATYQETAQVLIDKTISQDVTSSITLQSTSVQELKIPAGLEQRIREDSRVGAVILTNEEQCVLGVVDEACIMINIKRDPEDTNFLEIQNTSKAVASLYIDDLNEAFDTASEFHSVFIHTSDETNEMLETSGAVSGRGTISAVYTMPMESTDSMYEKISSVLLPKAIRESGGFYDVAKNLSLQEDAKMTFSLIPLEGKSLLQLKATVGYPGTAAGITDVSPLEYLQTEKLQRSAYFSTGVYPLNSLLQVVVLSPEPAKVSGVKGSMLETRDVGGELVPTDVSREGWVFDPPEGQKIQGKWIFGEETAVDGDTVTFSLDGEGGEGAGEPFDESVVVAVIISVVAAAAAAFYLKGYKK